jgi:hypothetical protein
MRKILSAAALCVALAFSPASGAHAASLNVDVDITLPNFLVLYCYDDISVSFTAGQLETALGVTGGGVTVSGTPTVSAAAGQITAALDIATEAPAITTTTNLLLQNVCGVRALSSTGSVSVGITSFASSLVSSGGNGSIAVNSVTPSTASLALTGGFGTVTPFNVTMALDLANAIDAGVSYAAASSAPEFVVEVTAP